MAHWRRNNERWRQSATSTSGGRVWFKSWQLHFKVENVASSSGNWYNITQLQIPDSSCYFWCAQWGQSKRYLATKQVVGVIERKLRRRERTGGSEHKSSDSRLPVRHKDLNYDVQTWQEPQRLGCNWIQMRELQYTISWQNSFKMEDSTTVLTPNGANGS